MTDANYSSQSIVVKEHFPTTDVKLDNKHNWTKHKSLDFTLGHLIFVGWEKGSHLPYKWHSRVDSSSVTLIYERSKIMSRYTKMWQVYFHIRNKSVQTYLTLARVLRLLGLIIIHAAYVQWIVWMEHEYNYSQHHSVLSNFNLFNCTPYIMFTLLCHANVTVYINTCFIWP